MARALGQNAFMQALNGRHERVATASATTTTSATTLTAGGHYVLPPDADVFVVVGPTATVANGLKIAANSTWPITLGSGDTQLSFITSSGSASVKIFRMT